MNYQLVLQFPASSIRDYDWMIELEGKIVQCLGDLGYVDGHDAGSGEMNIFIITRFPKRTFERIKNSIGTRDFMAEMRVAYRDRDGEVYTILHPKGLTEFTIK